MSGEVARLRSDPGVSEAPALGFSMQVDLGAGRVATLQTFLPNDCPLGELNEMLDKMTRAGDRQRAHYKIEELERDLEQSVRQHQQHQEDLDRIDAAYEKRQAERKAEAEKATKILDNFNEAARNNHLETGRRGEFKLTGGDKSRYEALSSSVAAVLAEMEKEKAEHDVAHANYAVTKVNWQKNIERTKEEIARCRAIVAAKG